MDLQVDAGEEREEERERERNKSIELATSAVKCSLIVV